MSAKSPSRWLSDPSPSSPCRNSPRSARGCLQCRIAVAWPLDRRPLCRRPRFSSKVLGPGRSTHAPLVLIAGLRKSAETARTRKVRNTRSLLGGSRLSRFSRRQNSVQIYLFRSWHFNRSAHPGHSSRSMLRDRCDRSSGASSSSRIVAGCLCCLSWGAGWRGVPLHRIHRATPKFGSRKLSIAKTLLLWFDTGKDRPVVGLHRAPLCRAIDGGRTCGNVTGLAEFRYSTFEEVR